MHKCIECIELCNFCTKYTDYSDTPERHDNEYVYVGVCSVTNKEVSACDYCEDFQCINCI